MKNNTIKASLKYKQLYKLYETPKFFIFKKGDMMAEQEQKNRPWLVGYCQTCSKAIIGEGEREFSVSDLKRCGNC